MPQPAGLEAAGGRGQARAAHAHVPLPVAARPRVAATERAACHISSAPFAPPPPRHPQGYALLRQMAVLSAHPLLALMEAAELIVEEGAADVAGWAGGGGIGVQASNSGPRAHAGAWGTPQPAALV